MVRMSDGIGPGDTVTDMLQWLCAHGYFLRFDWGIRREEFSWSLFALKGDDGRLERLSVHTVNSPAGYEDSVVPAAYRICKERESRPVDIRINGARHAATSPLTYDQVLKLAGLKRTVCRRCGRDADVPGGKYCSYGDDPDGKNSHDWQTNILAVVYSSDKSAGTLTPGKSVELVKDMHFTIADTSNA